MPAAIAIGIDVGSAFSSIAAAFPDGSTEVMSNEQGHRITPSIVVLDAAGQAVGDASAREGSARTAQRNTVLEPMRLIGRQFHDPYLQSHVHLFPFKVVPSKSDKALVVVNHQGREKTYNPEDIMANVFLKLKQTAEARLSHSIASLPVVLTVPACYNSVHRGALRSAAQAAGLNVVRLVAAPTAAALQFMMSLYPPAHHESLNTVRTGRSSNHNVLVIDIGAGSTDVTLLTMNQCSGALMKEQAVATELDLGGRDFDNRLVEYCIEDFRQKCGTESSFDWRTVDRLRTHCERAKRRLSQSATCEIEIERLVDGINYSLSLTRDVFETVCQDLFEKLLQPIQRCLEDSGVSKHDVNDVVAVGGSTRIPKVQTFLREFFSGREITIANDPRHDCLTACGAAMVSSKIFDNDRSIVPVLPCSLGVEVAGGVMQRIACRGTPMPFTKELTFTVIEETPQASMIVTVYEGESLMTKDNALLCMLCLDNVQPTNAYGHEITVSIGVDENGVKTLAAIERDSGVQAEARVMEDEVVCCRGRAMTKTKEFHARRQSLPEMSRHKDVRRCEQSGTSDNRPQSSVELRHARREIVNCMVATCIVPLPADAPKEQPSQASTVVGSLTSIVQSRSPAYDDDDDLDRTRAHVVNPPTSCDFHSLGENINMRHILDPELLQSKLANEFNSRQTSEGSDPRQTSSSSELSAHQHHNSGEASDFDRAAVHPMEKAKDMNDMLRVCMLERELEDTKAELRASQAAQKKLEHKLSCLQGEECILNETPMDELEKMERACLTALSRIQSCRNERRRKEDEERRLQNDCVICMASSKQIVFLPCGHLVCCASCSENVQQCPNCRGDIEKKIRAFA